MAQFDYYLNRQGVRGPQGEQGEQGFSPIITVATNTLSEYILQIQTQNNTFQTANLREHKDDLGGTYIRYNRSTGVMYAGDADIASQSQMGVVRFATSTDIEREASDCAVAPADVADMIEAADPSEDINALADRVTMLESEATNYVPKTRTINGHALSSDVTLTASDVNAYSKSETDTLLSAKANASDLPDMNNYYNTNQIDLMLNEKADISDIPTVGNGTITFTQGGVTKGTITTNQSGDTTIALDAGGGGTTYTEGTGIDITNDVISVDFTDVATASQGAKADTAIQPSDLATVATTGDYTDLLNTPSPYILPAATTSTLGGVIPDGSTITVDADGTIHSVGGGGTPTNMVTTDTVQTITGTKTFSTAIFNAGIQTPYVKNQTGTSICLYISNSNLKDNSTNGLIDKNDNPYLTSNNVGSYALTSSNISSDTYIQALVARIAALEANINGGSAASA